MPPTRSRAHVLFALAVSCGLLGLPALALEKDIVPSSEEVGEREDGSGDFPLDLA